MNHTNLLRHCALALAISALSVGTHAKTPDDQLVIGFSMNNLLSLDPAAATGNDVVEIAVNIYDYLIELDPLNTSKMQPGLAESWKVSPDGRSITLVLRKGVKFQSGNVLTADDAAWSLQRVLKLNLALASIWKTYGFTAQNAEKAIRATDAQTLVIDLPEPTDPKMVLYTLATSVSAVVLDRKKVMENDKNGDLGTAWLTTHAAGSGPFSLAEWRAKDVLLLNRFDDYWRGPAKLKRVIMRHMTESQSLRLMVDRGRPGRGLRHVRSRRGSHEEKRRCGGAASQARHAVLRGREHERPEVRRQARTPGDPQPDRLRRYQHHSNAQLWCGTPAPDPDGPARHIAQPWLQI